MECNKEEAIRAKEIAEQKLQKSDFALARKFAEKAQRLFPELENISQLLAVCEVHCSAENKLHGSQMDWYKILQIEQLDGEAIIRKQYRKLALLLHPDKNKFAGAEAAFKLIGEANRVLADPVSRSTYDMKLKAAVKAPPQKPPPRPFTGNSSVSQQHGATPIYQSVPNSQFPGFHHLMQTFWTCCFFCNMRFQYQKSVLHSMLRCTNCQRSFVAYDVGPYGVPPKNHNSVPDQGPPKFASQNGRGTKTKTKRDGNVNVRSDKDVGKSKSDAPVKPKESVTSRKRSRKSAVESGKSCETNSSDTDEDAVFQENGGNSEPNEGGKHRRSSRQKQHVSYNEKLNENDDFVSPVKKSRGDDLSKNTEGADGEGGKKEVKKKVNGPPDINSPNKKGKVTERDTKQEERATQTSTECSNEKSKDGDDSTSTPEIVEYPDPDFSDFEKDKAANCFSVDQIWAVYDTVDSMPRFYARIRKVYSPGFKVRITWLEPNPDNESEVEWCDKELPAACGKFKLGSSQETEDLPMFSHQITWMKGHSRGSYVIYPRKGEIWAIFRDWDISWHTDPEKHMPFKFEIVEVLEDFDEDAGSKVSYLGKVKGFVSIFRQTKLHDVTTFYIPPCELFRFSHRIPSFKMTGLEGKGVPEGSYELDPPSLPAELDEFVDPDVKPNFETNGSCPKSPENEVKPAVGSKRGRTPKKEEKNDNESETEELKRPPRQPNARKNHSQENTSQCASRVEVNKPSDNNSKGESHGNLTRSRGKATSSKADERSSSPMKQEKNDIEKESLNCRRSPRDLSKKRIE